MSRKLFLYFFSITLTLISTKVHATKPTCDDSKLHYKICVEQDSIYQKSYEEAKKAKKLLLVQFGFEECSWCQSLQTILDVKLNSYLKPNYQVAYINIREESGKTLFNKIKGKYSKSVKETGWPFWIVVNPESNTSDFKDTADLEDNSNGNGHDLGRVKVALENLQKKLKP